MRRLASGWWIFSLGFSCQTRELFSLSTREKITFFRRLFLFLRVAEDSIDFHWKLFHRKCPSFNAAEFLQFSLKIWFFSRPLPVAQIKTQKKENIFFYLHIWAFENRSPTRAPSGLFPFSLANLQTQTEKLCGNFFASDDCGKLWKLLWACALSMLLVF